MDKVAILVDGGFYQRRANIYWGRITAQERADELHAYCLKHLYSRHSNERDELYRIFYYDCPPCDKRVYHPLLDRQIDLKQTDLYTYMTLFHNAIRSKRKTALRLGELNDRYASYILRPEVSKKLTKKTISVEELKESDFTLDIQQKGVDIRIGLDIASMAYKRLITKVILISGDSDFVPAAKLARREGIDFVLDPMHAPIKPSLSEHIDGMRTCFPLPQGTATAMTSNARVED